MAVLVAQVRSRVERAVRAAVDVERLDMRMVERPEAGSGRDGEEHTRQHAEGQAEAEPLLARDDGCGVGCQTPMCSTTIVTTSAAAAAPATHTAIWPAVGNDHATPASNSANTTAIPSRTATVDRSGVLA